MDIFDTSALKSTLKVGFTQLGSIHTHRIVTDVEYAANVGDLQIIEYLVGRAPLISEREEIGSLD
jgi:hypothetical protein